MKSLSVIAALVLLGSGVQIATADDSPTHMQGTDSHMNHRADKPMEPGASAKTYSARGKVHKVDASAGTVYITHGPIKRLNWPSMNREYTVHDPAILKGIKAGMTVDFELEDVGNNTYHIVTIRARG